jgi:hypothetical protein
MAIVAVDELGFMIATPFVRFFSSHMSVVVVPLELAKGTTASCSCSPAGLLRKTPYPPTPTGRVKVANPCSEVPTFVASIMAVPDAAIVTCVELPPKDGTFKGVPKSE